MKAAQMAKPISSVSGMAATRKKAPQAAMALSGQLSGARR